MANSTAFEVLHHQYEAMANEARRLGVNTDNLRREFLERYTQMVEEEQKKAMVMAAPPPMTAKRPPLSHAAGMRTPPVYDFARDAAVPPAERFSSIVKAHQAMAKVYEFIAAQASMGLFGDDDLSKQIYERILVLGYEEFVKQSHEGGMPWLTGHALLKAATPGPIMGAQAQPYSPLGAIK